MGNNPHDAGLTEGPAPMDEQLVAYLDGELDDESSRRLEQQLASDSTLRDQLSRLERTWDALDELERIEVDQEFTRTTIEMVALAAEREHQEEERRRPARRRRQWLLGLAAIVLACFAGFAGTWYFLPDPNRQLIEDLPVLQRLDEYQLIDTIEFLKLLRDRQLFPAKTEDASTVREASPVVAAGPSAVNREVGAGVAGKREYEKNRARIEAMAPGDKRQLSDNWRRFDKLSDEKQEGLRNLHGALQLEGDREELERVMEAYCEWASDKLSAPELSHLDRLLPAERIEQVAAYKASPRRQFGRRDGFWDMARNPYGTRWFGRGVSGSSVKEYADALKTWAGRYVADRAEVLAELLPREEGTKWKAGLAKAPADDPEQVKSRWIYLVRWYLAGPKQDMPIDGEDVASLEALLSPNARKFFEQIPPEAKKREIPVGLRRMIGFHFQTGQPEFENLIAAEDLDRFRKTLSVDMEENLRKFPSAEKQNEWVRFAYFQSKLPRDARSSRDDRHSPGSARPPYGPPSHDGPSGPRRGPGGEPREPGDGPRGMRPGPAGIPPPPADQPAEKR